MNALETCRINVRSRTYQLGTGNTNRIGEARPEQKNIYVLASNGPDKEDDSQPIDPFPLRNPTRWVPYESSNGLSSKGDVWRFGGSTPWRIFNLALTR